MNLALLVALLLPTQGSGDQPTTLLRPFVRNYRSLVENDFVGENHILSLRDSGTWSAGTAWLFRLGKDAAVWKGDYSIYRPTKADDDMLILRIAFSRQYVLVVERDQWQLNRRYEPKGMIIEIPLEDHGVPKDIVTFSVVRGFFVNEKGQEIVKHHEARGLVQKFTGGEVRELRELDCVSIGATLELEPDNKFFKEQKLDDLLPPGYHVRKVIEKKQAEPAPVKTTRKDELLRSMAEAVRKNDPELTLKIADLLAEIAPGRTEIYSSRGWAHSELKQYEAAVTDYSQAVRLSPKTASYYASRAWAYEQLGKHANVIADYRAALNISPSDPKRLNGLAWKLATCVDADCRDGMKAIEYASEACEKTDYRDFLYLDTLAAACAEAGDFKRAVLWQTEVVRLADDACRDRMRKRLDLYSDGKPYRE